MSLIKCNECGKEISNQSKVCINCGVSLGYNVIEKKTTHFFPIGISCIIFFILIMVYNIMDIQTDSNKSFYTVFNTILLLGSIGGITSSFYLVPKNRKILFPLSVIVSIFVFMSVMGTAFRAFN